MPSPSKINPPAKPSAEISPELDKRVWYQKKRFAFPVLGVFFVFLAMGIVGGTNSGSLSPASPGSSEETNEGRSGSQAGSPSAKNPVAIGKSSGGSTSQTQPSTTLETALQREARAVAQSYYESSWFSRSGMIEQLEFEGFSFDDSVYGVDSLGVDWNAEAIGMADSYIESSWFSRIGLIDQLEFEGFSSSESQYGVDSLGIDWYQEAIGMAWDYLDYSDFTYEELVDQLIFEGFSEDEAVYGVSQSGYF